MTNLGKARVTMRGFRPLDRWTYNYSDDLFVAQENISLLRPRKFD